MNPVLKLYEKCQGDGDVALVIPRRSTGERIRLTPQGGPLGYILTGDDKKTVAHFSRARVRKFLEREFPYLLDLSNS